MQITQEVKVKMVEEHLLRGKSLSFNKTKNRTLVTRLNKKAEMADHILGSEGYHADSIEANSISLNITARPIESGINLILRGIASVGDRTIRTSYRHRQSYQRSSKE